MKFRTRLLIAITATTGLTLGGAFTAVSVAIDRSQEGQLDDALLAEARQEAFESSEIGGTQLVISSRPGPAADDTGHLTKYGIIYSKDGVVLASTPTFGASCPVFSYLSLPTLRDSPFDRWCGKEHLRVVVVPIPKQDGPVLLLGAPRTNLDADEAYLLRTVLTAFVLSVALAFVLSTWLVRRLTRDHQAIAAATHRVAAGDLSARIDLRYMDSEMAQLAADVDAMVERLAALVTSQRRFVAYAAHELQSPLASLYAELQQALRKPRDAEGYRAAIEGALDSARRLTRLAHDLLSLLKSEHSMAPREALPIVTVVADVVTSLRALADSREVTVHVRGREGIVSGHRSDLERLLRNLIENAIHHSPRGQSVEVAVDIVGPSVEVAVTDLGPGVPEADRERIFEPFYRSPATSSELSEGSGLGLSIAREIARAHGGEVVFRETERRSVFVAKLPFAT